MEDAGIQPCKLAFSEDMDLHTGDKLRDLVRPNVAPGVEIQLDLSQVSFIDSSGIEILIRLAGEVREAGGQLTIVRTSRQMNRVLGVTGLDRALGINLPR